MGVGDGYEQYGVAHLVRLLRRLAELGFSLPQIADLGDGDEHPAEALRTLDAAPDRGVVAVMGRVLGLAGTGTSGSVSAEAARARAPPSPARG